MYIYMPRLCLVHTLDESSVWSQVECHTRHSIPHTRRDTPLQTPVSEVKWSVSSRVKFSVSSRVKWSVSSGEPD